MEMPNNARRAVTWAIAICLLGFVVAGCCNGEKGGKDEILGRYMDNREEAEASINEQKMIQCQEKDPASPSLLRTAWRFSSDFGHHAGSEVREYAEVVLIVTLEYYEGGSCYLYLDTSNAKVSRYVAAKGEFRPAMATPEKTPAGRYVETVELDYDVTAILRSRGGLRGAAGGIVVRISSQGAIEEIQEGRYESGMKVEYLGDPEGGFLGSPP